MAVSTIGDLAQSFMTQRRTVALRDELNRLTDELSTGRIANIRESLAGNFSYLAEIERDLRTAEGFRVAGVEAEQYASGIQRALERVQTTAQTGAQQLIAITETSTPSNLLQASSAARQQLEAVVAALNTTQGGRALFGGAATDSVPVASADDILDQLEAVIAGQTSPGTIRAAARVWFDDPAGFEAAAYRGSADGITPFKLTRTETVAVNIRAVDPALKNTVMDLALAAISDRAVLGLDLQTAQDVQREAGLSLFTSQQELVGLRGQVGSAEQRIDVLRTRNESQRISLDMARTDLLAADPFETASRLEMVQFRLEGLYTVTARLSDLSLVNFLR